MTTGALTLARETTALLDTLGIDYVIGGSVASSLVGEPRATIDLDLAVTLATDQVAPLLEALAGAYYASERAVHDAVQRRSSFNVIHLETMQKVDLFVLGDGLLDRLQMARRQEVFLDEAGTHRLWVGSPADQVLGKLWWFRLGNEVSERQWRDVLAILRVQGAGLDLADLRSTAQAEDLTDLLERALAEAGLTSP
ncbi:MAG: hypothetical protein WKF93_09425 [Acidimicrobiales bacterium]